MPDRVRGKRTRRPFVHSSFPRSITSHRTPRGVLIGPLNMRSKFERTQRTPNGDGKSSIPTDSYYLKAPGTNHKAPGANSALHSDKHSLLWTLAGEFTGPSVVYGRLRTYCRLYCCTPAVNATHDELSCVHGHALAAFSCSSGL